MDSFSTSARLRGIQIGKGPFISTTVEPSSIKSVPSTLGFNMPRLQKSPSSPSSPSVGGSCEHHQEASCVEKATSRMDLNGRSRCSQLLCVHGQPTAFDVQIKSKFSTGEDFNGHHQFQTSKIGSIVGFLREKGFDDKNMGAMLKKCKRLQGTDRDSASENWAYLRSIGIEERKLPSIVAKCPKLLTLGLDEKLAPMVDCLATLGSKPSEATTAIMKFPNILSHSVEEKLCPLLAFFQALGVPEKQTGKLLLLNPRLISYSIETKLSQIVNFLAGLGLDKDGLIGKVLVKNPFIMGYCVERRLKPTLDFLRSLGLTDSELQKVVTGFPEVLCRDVDKILKPNLLFLRSCGFLDGQIAALVAGYPPVLIKSVKNSLEPRIKFLVEVMGRGLEEVVGYPEFFKFGLKRRLEYRQRMLKGRNLSDCSLNEMLSPNHKTFVHKFSLC